MKKLYIGIVFIALLFAYGCSDFLDVDSQEKVETGDSEEVYEPVQFVNAAYGMFTDWDYAFSYLALTEIISDNADKGSSPSDGGGGKDLADNLTYTSTAGDFQAMWSRWYKSIGRASQAIEYARNYEMADEAYRNRLIGEAKFLRAVNYFFLVRGWGDIPVQEKDLTVRVSKEDVYAYIEQDLKDAMSSLPAKYDDANIGRATKGAAQGLLSKVYLYQGKWQEAYDNANAVITSSEYGYGLMPDYRDIWKVTGENKEESLFEFQARGESPAHGIQQYSQTQGARGETGWGWGFNTPSENLLQAFEAEGDAIRKEATIMFRNSTLYDGRVIGNTENPMYNMKAYSSANLGDADGDKNIRYLRLGEIYLIRAEAANELGNTTGALADLNKIRNRVELADVTTTNKDELRKAIWHERRLELAFEHDRWFDLIRTGEAESAMKADGKPFVKGKHELFPIPNQQLIEIPGLGQNPNW
jgi:hypothetical protein